MYNAVMNNAEMMQVHGMNIAHNMLIQYLLRASGIPRSEIIRQIDSMKNSIEEQMDSDFAAPTIAALSDIQTALQLPPIK